MPDKEVVVCTSSGEAVHTKQVGICHGHLACFRKVENVEGFMHVIDEEEAGVDAEQRRWSAL